MNIFSKTILVVFACALSYHLHAQTKIAVIPDKGLENYVDLLTIELSKQKDLNVIERAEIEKIFKEQEISSKNLSANYLKLGKLLKADGLIIIMKYGIQKKEFLLSRLVAVNQGTVLSAFSNPYPAEKIADWTADISAKFAPYLNKLDVSQDKAVPISILNIWAPIDTPEMRLLEKEFTLALAFRLVQEKDLFVLERWKMEKLAWEKDIDTDSSSPFWTGSYLLDGSIELADKDNVNVKVRLRKPSGPELTIEATGSRDKLSEITEKVTVDLLKQIGKTQDKIPWDSAKEAEQYLKEAEWALKNNLFNAAISAIENAYALGCRTDEGQRLKIEAYSYAAHNTFYDILGGYTLNKDIPYNEYIKTESHIDYALFSIEKCRKYLTEHHPSSGSSKEEQFKWRSIGESTVLNASVTLRAFADQGNVDKCTAKTTLLRKLIREISDDIISSLDDSAMNVPFRMCPRIFNIKITFLPAWCETPEDTIAEYKKTLDITLPLCNGLRFWMLNHFGHVELSRANKGTPVLIGWRNEYSKEQLNQLWDKFLENLSSSKSPKEAEAGLYALSGGPAKANPDNKYLLKLTELYWNEREKILKGEIGLSFETITVKTRKMSDGNITEFYYNFLKYILENGIELKLDRLPTEFWILQDAWMDDKKSNEQKNEIASLLAKYNSLKNPSVRNSKTAKPDKLPEKQLIVKEFHSPFGITSEGISTQGVALMKSKDKIIVGHMDKIYVINAGDMGTEVINSPIPLGSVRYSCVGVAGNVISMVSGNDSKIFRYDMNNGKWSSAGLPKNSFPSCSKSIGDDVYISSCSHITKTSDIIKYNISLNTNELIASSRRRPAETPLDDCDFYIAFKLIPVRNNNLIIIAEFNGNLDDKAKAYLCSTQTHRILELSSLENAELSSIFKHSIIIEDWGKDRKLFLTYDDKTGEGWHIDGKYTRMPQLEMKSWRCPERFQPIISRYNQNSYDGDRLILISRAAGEVYLNIFDDNNPTGIAIPLKFEFNNRAKEVLANPSFINCKYKLESPGDYLCLPQKGVFIQSESNCGFWFIPQERIDAFIKMELNGENSFEK